VVVLENFAAELYWRSLLKVSNVEGELGSSVVREVM